MFTAEIRRLKTFFQESSGYFPEREIFNSDNTQLPSGLALSPAYAAMCLDGAQRTAVFIRGVHQAIRDRVDAKNNLPIHVLYAGCGPFAPFSVSQMVVFSPGDVQFTLMDIHKKSLQSAKHLIRSLGFEGFVVEYIHDDAAEYQVPNGTEPDIILSETMNAALGKEPQVEIFRNLALQSPESSLVPAKVTVSAALMRSRRECNRDLGTVFELSRRSIDNWPQDRTNLLPAATISLPDVIPKYSNVMLQTKVEVYKDFILADNDDEITIPQRLPLEMSNIQGGEKLRFQYRLSGKPGLVLKEILK